MKAVRPVASRLGFRFEHRSSQHTSRQTQRNGAGRRGKPWRLLRARVATQGEAQSGNVTASRFVRHAVRLVLEEPAIAGGGFRILIDRDGERLGVVITPTFSGGEMAQFLSVLRNGRGFLSSQAIAGRAHRRRTPSPSRSAQSSSIPFNIRSGNTSAEQLVSGLVQLEPGGALAQFNSTIFLRRTADFVPIGTHNGIEDFLQLCTAKSVACVPQ